jgi:peptide/nickel transport system permease protein
MTGFVLRRTLLAIPTMLGISIVIFLLVRLLPGDVLEVMLGGDVSSVDPETLEQAREQLGIKGSYPEQYWNWISGIFTGDFGDSLRSAEPVSNIVGRALPVTLEIVFLSLIISVVVGLPLGIVSAVRRDKAADYISRFTALVGVSVPGFWLATLLLLFTSKVIGWVPPLSPVSLFDDPWRNVQQYFLPAISISVFTMAIVMRMVRATMLEVLGLDYVRTARAKGVPRRKVISRHALRNALIPVVTIVGFEVGVLMGGAAIVELVFGLPGIGYNLLQAVSARDYPVVQALTLLFAFTFILFNLIVDLLYGVLDPRISQG